MESARTQAISGVFHRGTGRSGYKAIVHLGLRTTAILFVLIGLSARVLPMFDHGGRLLQMNPTEDGYLMLTIARNLAVGKGLSIADGTIPTNGTQPLVTLLWALCYLIVSGHKIAGVMLVQLVQVAASVVGAFLLYRLGLKVFEGRADKKEISLLAAAAWYGSGLVVPLSMNCLETGVFAVAVLLVAAIFTEPSAGRERLWSYRKCVAVGVLLGVTFWVRNDAVFLILAACVVHLYNGLPHGLHAMARRFRRALVFGSISVLVALPWITFNYVAFGHIVPISGRAERLRGAFASNLLVLPTALSEYAALLIPIPQMIRSETYTLVAAIVFLSLLIPVVFRLFARATAAERSLVVLTGVFGAGLCLFYGLFFGAPWFVRRYLFPLGVLFALAWASVILRAHQRISRTSRFLAHAALAVLVLVVVPFHVRAYDKGKADPHFQVVRWVEDNVSEETWVGALQTGALGYFHDRTINLDGKVNVHAYNALVARRIADYVVDDTAVIYLVDWTSMIDWLRTWPRLDEQFEVVVADHEKNLGVLKRKGRPPRS